MKKQHLYRLSAIALFACILLGIMPIYALQISAAEDRKSALPEDGKTYIMRGILQSDKNNKLRVYDMMALGVDENGQNHSYLYTTNYPTYFVNVSFTFEEIEDGVFKILPVSMPGWCLQVSKASFLAGHEAVRAASFENKPEQLWTLKENGNGYYLSCMSEPEKVLGGHPGAIHPVPIDDKDCITFYFEETAVTFPDTQIHVKAPEGWYPGLWVTPKNEDPIEWGGFTIMEKNEDGWFSYPAPWDSSCDCSIVNHAETGVAAQGYTHDELFDLEDLDFSTDKWVVITDDPNVEGDLTYKIYDHNPDEEPLKPGQAYTISIGWPLSIMPEKGLQGTNLMVGGQGNLSFSFYFDKTKDGYYTISPASMTGWRLQLSEGKIITEKPQDIPEQKWSIVACDDGYTISSAADPTLFIGKTTPPADHNQESGDLVLSVEPDHKVWKIKESPLTFSEHSVYVKAPEHWAPGLLGDYGSWCVGIMEKQANGWFSFPLYPYQPEYYRCRIMNYMVDVWSSQYDVPDSGVDLYQLESDKDYWVVITDDPNVAGDLTYKVYDYNPDGESPKTADPVMLVIPAIGLLASATAMICLLRRRKAV